MAATSGHRGWGWLRKLPSGRYQASYIGPDGIRHNAPHTFTAKLYAEGWLSQERQSIELGTWITPKRRKAEKKAAVLTLGDYSAEWIKHRNVKPRTKIEYESSLSRLIAPILGGIPLSELNPEAIRSWYSSLGRVAVRRNSHAYGLLHAICATAVKDGLLVVNPCQISRVMNPPTKREPVILTVNEVARLADEIEAIEPKYKALVLISAWCGLRWGEVIELRRRDIRSGCETISVSRAVTHRGACRIDTPKSGKARTVVVPPHIRSAIKHHLDSFVAADDSALLFTTEREACHLNDSVFMRSALSQLSNLLGVKGFASTICVTSQER